MIYSWSKTVFPIAAIFSFRMLGLFLLIPVFTVYAINLHGANPTLIGIALGGYGLTQGLLQIPFGILSDKFGRKPLLTIGLILFAFGSLLGALTDSIYGMIIARAIQGTGAIGSVLIALMADLTPDSQRTKAMAVIGMTIGASFSLAMVLGPAITAHFGLSGIFYLTTFLAFMGIILLHLVIPTPIKEPFHAKNETHSNLFKSSIKNKHLQRLNLGIFCQHFILTATFFAIPMILSQQIREGNLTQQWHFYLPLIIASFIIMIPFIVLAEKKKKMKVVFLLSVLITSLMQAFLAIAHLHWINLCSFMFIYFIAFNILEASLPSLVSKQVHLNQRGTAMGIYSTGQFLGIFAGGSLAGVIYQHYSYYGLFIVNAVIGLIWFIVACYMTLPTELLTVTLTYYENDDDKQLRVALLALPGVIEVSLTKEEHILHIKADKKYYQNGSAEQVIDAINNKIHHLLI